MTMEAASRPVLDERREYRARGRQEELIVPLLRAAVEGALRRYGVRAGAALDAGCGGQPFRAVIEREGMSYTSLDTQQQPRVQTDFLCALDGELPAGLVARGPFDLVLCTEVLEHVADWESAWRNLAALAAPGGAVVVTCPQFYPLHEEPYDFWRPTLHAIRFFAQRHGLTVAEERKLGDAWDVIGTAVAASTPDPASGGPLSWAVATAARKARKAGFWVVKRRALDRFVRARSKLYLANFAVLRKPSAGGGTR